MSSNTPPDRNLDLPTAQAMDPKDRPCPSRLQQAETLRAR